MKKKKVVILVLSFNKDPWWKIENEGIRKTWGSDIPRDVEVLYYYGGRSSVEQDRLYFPHPEGYQNIGYKTLDAFQFVKDNYDFDFIFRTNTSSYVNIPNLIRHYEERDPLHHLYSAVKCVPPPGDPRPVFASGCGYSLSRKTVDTILADKESWDHKQIDDLALATLMLKHGIPITDVPRFDIGHPSHKNRFTEDHAKQHFHVRCKCEHSTRDGDIEIMHHVHEVFNKKALSS